MKKKPKNAISELNALCDVLSFMRSPTAFPSAKRMYKRFCGHGIGTIDVRYLRKDGKVFLVAFEYTTWLGMISRLSIDTTKYY